VHYLQVKNDLKYNTVIKLQQKDAQGNENTSTKVYIQYIALCKKGSAK